MKIICSIFLVTLLYVINHRVIQAADYYHCYSTGNFTDGSPYGSSRDSQLFDLATQVKNQDGYYSGTTITIPPSPVPSCYGLCRKDLISSVSCYNCINNSTKVLLNNCLVQKEVVAWGDNGGCIVRCVTPNNPSHSYETSPSVHVCNTTNVSQNYLPQFDRFLANLTGKIAVEAAQEGSSSSFPSGYNKPQYYASDESNFIDLIHEKIYGVGFCVPNLSTNECSACLQAATNESNNYCHGQQGATILTPSCVLRYELYPFYESGFSGASPSPSPARASPPGSSSKDVRKGNRETRALVVAIVLPLIAILTVIFLPICFNNIWMKRKQSQLNREGTPGSESMESCLELSLNTIRVATNDFSDSNKLGEGGFGTVYKGTLPNGHLVAVKRLTRHTAHGDLEFKNEVQIVAKLHHKNLVRLLGFSLGVRERILIYELALNGSLDSTLFDPIRQEHLHWEIRHRIIEGIARGLLYLHEESQLKIVHRDLKASNVLLDESMNPKIADFGTARLYAEDHDSASKIVGTYGYMAPEYAKYGKLSTKVDVFSFGVLLLEIISGTKNNTSRNSNRTEHLLSKAWKCWTTGHPLKLIDPVLQGQNGHIDEITRFIHIGLLCVQENAQSRPSMSLVVLKLDGCSQSLPIPSEPAYLMNLIGDDEASLPIMRAHTETRDHVLEPVSHMSGPLSSSSHGFSSVNEISFTNTYPEPR